MSDITPSPLSNSDLQSLSRQSCMDVRFAIFYVEKFGYFYKSKAFFLQILFLESYDFKK